MKPLCRTEIIACTLIINIWQIMNYVRGEGFATILRLVKAFFIEKLILLLIANEIRIICLWSSKAYHH